MNAECGPPYVEFKNPITSNMICASGLNQNTCRGDSGGPLAHFDHTHNYWMLIGVTSFGHKETAKAGCKSSIPSVFARVTSQLNWINAHITGQTCPIPTF